MFVMEFNNYSIAEDESTSLISLLHGTPYVAGKRVAGSADSLISEATQMWTLTTTVKISK